MFKFSLYILFLTLTVSFVYPSLSYSDADFLNELKKEAVKDDEKNEKNRINIPNETGYINNALNPMEKYCREKKLSEYDCKRLVRNYEIKNYIKNRNLQPGLSSQKNFE